MMSYLYNIKKKGKPLPPEFKNKVKLSANNKWIKLEKPERKTYSQNWHAYNKYQTEEKLLFYKILNDSVESLHIDEKFGSVGRPFNLMSDMLKCCVIKIFCGFSSRRTISELKLVQKLGYIKQVPHYNSIINYFDSEEMQVHLSNLYRTLALPLKGIESKFAIDASGFSTSIKENWLSVRLDNKPIQRTWRKLHIVTGVQTNVVSAAKITKAYSHDILEFQNLIGSTAKDFNVSEVSADAGYLSRSNVDFVGKLGAVPYIMPKSNIKKTTKPLGSSSWKNMIKMWSKNKEEFKKHYHLRSNAESTFSMLKRKFSDHLRSKKEQAQTNEILCKVVCHNISVLVSGIFELDLKLEWN